MVLKLQFDRTCFQKGEASASVDVGNNTASTSPTHTRQPLYAIWTCYWVSFGGK